MKHIREKTPCSLVDLGKQGRHLQSQLLVDGEVSSDDGLVGLEGQEESLPLRLPPHLEREIQPAARQADKETVRQEPYRAIVGMYCVRHGDFLYALFLCTSLNAEHFNVNSTFVS